MIRWSYVFPRLLILALTTLVVCFALDPLARWSIITTAQRATGAKVEIAALQSSLLRSAVRVTDLQMADPGQLDRNLLEADEIILLLDPRSLLHRRWVVDRAHVRGLRFDTGRTTSGALEQDPDEEEDAGGSDLLSGIGEKLIDGVLGKLEKDAESLESVQLSRELMQRWPAEYSQLENRVDALKAQINQLRQTVDAARHNPLRSLETLEQTLSNIASLQQAPAQLRGELQRLQRQVHLDRQAVDEARRRDMQRIREELHLENVDTESLVQYLVGDEWSQHVKSLVGWIEKARALAGAGGDAPQEAQGRGQEIIFPGIAPQPDFLIRTVLVEGEGNFGRTRVPFTGTIQGITSQPKIYGRPVVCKLQSNAAGNLRVHATVDQTGEVTQTQVVIDCPELPQPETTLGHPDKLAVDVAPGTGHLWAHLKLTGTSDLSGRIVLKRDRVAMTPRAGEQVTDKLATEAWQQAFQDVHDLHAAADLAGTVTKPQWKLKTNLGPQISSGLTRALRSELAARQQQLTAQLQQVTDQQMARLTEDITAKQEQLLAKLKLGESEIEQLRQLIAQHTKLPGLDLSRKLPFDKFLQR